MKTDLENDKWREIEDAGEDAVTDAVPKIKESQAYVLKKDAQTEVLKKLIIKKALLLIRVYACLKMLELEAGDRLWRPSAEGEVPSVYSTPNFMYPGILTIDPNCFHFV